MQAREVRFAFALPFFCISLLCNTAAGAVISSDGKGHDTGSGIDAAYRGSNGKIR